MNLTNNIKNNNVNKKPLLLSPAGSKESVYAAVLAGADAIYVGGKNYNARQNASNLSDSELEEIIDYCHLRNVKVLIALNILYKNSEINSVLKFALKMYNAGADAFIIQDLGIFNLIKNMFSDIRLHASTQMTIHNKNAVDFLNKQGFDRIVLSRELSIEEINDIAKNTNAEIECFIHGALCVCYSGRCLMSSFLGQRSGNRGYCAQPCRLKYNLFKENKKIKSGYLISPKDIMTVDLLEELVNSKINTFKIEGRMKSPEYVFCVTKIYRKYIDEIYENGFIDKNSKSYKDDIKELTQIFSRGGSFSTGYFKSFSGVEMISDSQKNTGIKIGIVENYNKIKHICKIRLYSDIKSGDGIEIWTKTEPHVGIGISKNSNSCDLVNIKIEGNISKGDFVYKSFDKELDDKIKNLIKKSKRTINISADVQIKLDKPISLNLFFGNIKANAQIQPPEKALNRPVSVDEIKKQLSKTNNTSFNLVFKNINIDDNIFIPLKDLNELRRKAINELENKIIQSFKRKFSNFSEYKPNFIKTKNKKKFSAQVNTIEQFDKVCEFPVDRIYIDFNAQLFKNINYFIEKAHKSKIKLFAAFPYIYRKNSEKEFEKLFSFLEKSQIDGYLIRNFPPIATKKIICADYTFNIFNNAAAEFMLKMFNTITLSAELNINELKGTAFPKSEIIIYGKLPLMTTHQCPVGIYAGEKNNKKYCFLKNKNGNYYITDRKNTVFPIQRDCFNCTSYILNSTPIFTAHKLNDIMSIDAEYFRLIFTDETAQTTFKILKAYTDKNTDIKEIVNEMKHTGYTNGHFFRGVL